MLEQVNNNPPKTQNETNLYRIQPILEQEKMKFQIKPNWKPNKPQI